jgi:arylsulfatase A-like enzyme
VLLFISDQQRADTMPGVRATPGIQTPHLAWLERQSACFRRAYCVTPLCTPARAALLSGLYPHATGMAYNVKERSSPDATRLPESVTLLAGYLRDEGYACGYAGKWHLGTRGDRRGFDDYVARSHPSDVDRPEQIEPVELGRRVGLTVSGLYAKNHADYNARTRTGTPALPMAYHPSMVDAEKAVHFVRRHAQADNGRPLLLAYSCHEPHPPFICPEPFRSMYGPEGMPLPESRRDPDGPRLKAERSEDHLSVMEGISDADLQKMWAGYYGSVSYVDHLLGTILAALADTDQLENTIVVYTSDHGEMLGSHGLWQKGGSFYEELVNIPLTIRPPGGLGAHVETTRLVSHVDVVPTVLGMCGVAVPHGLHGIDLRPLVSGEDAPVRDGVAFEYRAVERGRHETPLRGWRTEEWKYGEGVSGGEELSNLRADPAERHNAIDEPEAAEARERMAAALRDWCRRTGDTWPALN